MGKASRDKGKRGEREARDRVRALWASPDCVRTAQVSGKFSSDLMGVPGDFHVEVKRYKRIVACDFLAQASEDCKDGEIPVVLLREDGGDWIVMMRMEDSPEFAARLSRHLEQRESSVPEVRGEQESGD